MSKIDSDPNKDAMEQAQRRSVFMSLAVAAGYIDDGSPLHISHQNVIEETVRHCHYLLGRTDELHDGPEAALERTFGLGAYPTTAEVDALMDSLPRLAGYQDPKPLPPAWKHLIKLTAQRCVDLVRNGKRVNLESEDAVEAAFGVVGFKSSDSVLVDYKAFLRQADHITQAGLRRVLRSRWPVCWVLPSPCTKPTDVWERNLRTKRGQRWVDAQTTATAKALAGIGGVEGATFELEFLYDL